MPFLPPAAGSGEGRAEALAWRELLLAGLLEDPSLLLVAHDERVAHLWMANGTEVALVAVARDSLSDGLGSLLDALTQEKKSGLLHVVVVGGGPEVVQELKKRFSFWQLSRQFGFHHLEFQAEAGTPVPVLRLVAGKAFAPLQKALARAAAIEPLTEAQVAALLAHSRQRDDEQARLEAGLSRRFPWVTFAIAALCIVLFALGKYWEQDNFLAVLYRMGANSRQDVAAGEVWRLFASAFLHANIQHIFVNLLALVGFGLVLERLLGPRRYVVLYGLSALGGSLASAHFRGAGLSVGASGAIWGLMTAGVGLAIRPRGLLPPLSLAHARRNAAVPLIINALYSFVPGVDLFAHFGGGAVGLVLMVSGLITHGVRPVWAEGPAPEPARRGAWGSVVWTLGAIALAVAMLASVAVALAKGRPWEIKRPPVLQQVQIGDTGLRVRLPSVIAARPEIERRDITQTFSYGDLRRSPLAVEIVVTSLPAPLAPGEMRAAMLLLQAAAAAAPPDTLSSTAPVITSVGGRPTVTVERRMKSYVQRSWLSIVGSRRVILQVYYLPDCPPAWIQIQDRIAESLQDQTEVERRLRIRPGG
jgi:rhomboid protease GluP